MRRPIAVALLALAVAAGCSGGDDDVASGAGSTTTGPGAGSDTTAPAGPTTTEKPPLATTTVPTTAAPTTEPPTTDPPATTTPTTVGGPSDFFDSPEAAALAVFDAWVAGDEARARRAAPAAVVDELFRTDGTFAAENYIDQGCVDSTEEPVCLCQWSYEGGAMTLVVGDSDAFGFQVTDLRYIAD